MLTRVFAVLGDTNLGYQVADYTAYGDIIGDDRHRATAIPLPAAEADQFSIPAERLAAR